MKARVLFFMCFLSWTTEILAQDFPFARLDVSDGLSHNRIHCFLRDRTGFLWIGTNSGLNRFDGQHIKIYRNEPGDTTTIFNDVVYQLFEMPDGTLGVVTSAGLCFFDPGREIFTTQSQHLSLNPLTISDVIGDRNHNYYLITNNAGLLFYDHSGVVFEIKHDPNDSSSVASDAITHVVPLPDNESWIIHRSGILEKIRIDNKKATVLYRTKLLFNINRNESHNYKLLVDDDGDVWIFVSDDNRGIFLLDVAKGKLTHFHQNAVVGKLSADLVSAAIQDNRGFIWVSTDHGGINIIDKKSFSIRYVLHQPDNERSLGQNSVTTMYKDDEGIIWVGTYKKGVSYYHENIIRFPLFKKYPSDPFSLPYDDVNRFVEDDQGNLWIGTNGGGLVYFDRQTGKFTSFRNDPANPNSISSDVIVSLCMDSEKKLWIGTYYGGLNCYDGKKFTRFNHNPSDPSSIASRSIWEIFEDSQKRLWIGTLDGGLDLFNRDTKTFAHFRPGDLNSVQSSHISAITEDLDGNIWIGTGNGVDLLSKQTGRFEHYGTDVTDPNAIRSISILDIRADSQGSVWVGTYGGLSRFNPKDKTFTTFTKANGLPHNTILSILEDRRGNLWIGTPNGLSNMILDRSSREWKIQFKNYSEEDGLQGRQFNENAAFHTRSGELIFGGANGFNIFSPDKLGQNLNKPRVVLTDFQLFSKSVRPGESFKKNVLLPLSITQAPPITLQADKNVFSIEFSALNFFQPGKTEYQYRLEGFNTNWLTADSKSNRVTFTNLDPGEYTFRVRASNSDGIWNNEGASLAITVLPPFWKSTPAFVLYGILFVLAIYVTRRLMQQRIEMRFAIQQERQEALRMHELDMMKIKFFTNVSHEFRTPITLILTPIERLMKQVQDAELKGQFDLIQRNAKRLLNLVNQLLDFRKIETQEIKFRPSEGDVVKFIRETVYSFSDLSEKKDIGLDFNSSVHSLETIFDQDKLEKILFNLLSNAFKFTPGGGSVEVTLNQKGENHLEIRIRDTGIGIERDKQERIFERFFQTDLPKSIANQGSGIGLSITYEFVKAHGGTITVESEIGKGSCFIVTLPVNRIATVSETISENKAIHSPEGMVEESESRAHADQKPLLLLVEDNEDFRFYLKDNLKTTYQIIEAKDGVEGWKNALTHFPNLIVSDIMMPEMNGIELCKKIKADQRVSHIPVVLLTARTSEEQELEGLEMGADDYIHKPFAFEILESRIRNLIVQRQKLHKAFGQNADIKISDLRITSIDEQLMQKVMSCVEANIANADFSVDDLCHETGMSRALFFKKMMALTGKSPLEFIRAIRLKHAAQLLEKSQLTVAEIAYKVGFNNPKYFARYFKEAFHVLPSAYALGKRKV